MEWLNYHHLLYFWAVAREGGLVPAGKLLRLSHPTLSAQIHALEDRLEAKLFERRGRRLVLTDTGRVVYGYAEEIFSLGQELIEATRGQASGRPLRLEIGVADALPKLVVRRLLSPVMDSPEPVKLVCREATYDTLLAELAQHRLDVVLSDAPVPAGSTVRAFNHFLGESGVCFFAAPELYDRFRRGFPRSLEGAPVLLPLEGAPLRRSLEQWFQRVGVRPRVVAELEDSALLKVLGKDGFGVFPAPAVVAGEVARQYQVRALGAAEGVRERYYALSVERRLKHPAVVALTAAAREELVPPG